MKEGEVWVLKASMVNQAGQVHLIESVERLTMIVENNEDIREWVLQRYMSVSSFVSIMHCS